jgi:hypothetical protein
MIRQNNNLGFRPVRGRATNKGTWQRKSRQFRRHYENKNPGITALLLMNSGYIHFFDAFQMQFDVFLMCFIPIFTDNLQDIIVNKITFAPIDN